MSTTAFPDISLLLEPINEANPSGEDMSFSPEFDKIQEARREDDPSLDQGEWVTQIKEADWPRVLDLCQSLLESRSKDLRVALWYCEAATKIHGVKGLQQGFELTTSLLQKFWDDLHPQAEDGDHEQRIGNLSLFLKRANELVRTLPLVRGRGQHYSLLELGSARALQLQLERNPEAADESSPNRVTLQQFREAQKATPRGFYQQAMQDAAHGLDALARLAQAADERLGLDGPSFSTLRAALEEYAETIARLAKENGVVDPAAIGAESGGNIDAIAEESESTADSSGPAIAHGPIRNREQALQQLRIVAEFFRRTEPHSPVAYLADKAARWGEMPLHVWLKAVLKEDGALARFEDLLGFADQPEES